MSFFDHIHACNRHDPSGFRPFRVEGMVVGKIRHGFADRLRGWPEVFTVSDASVDLASALECFESRTEAVAEVLRELERLGEVDHLHGERYAATAQGRREALLLIDRAAAPYFGIRAFGQHVNGFVRDGERLRLWIGRRAADRRVFPGRLDNLAAGGLPYGVSLRDNLVKECWEEANIPAELALKARPVGAVNYNAESEKGFKPDTLYCYDLELPADFVPRCNDGEVEDFYLWPVEEVMARVRDTEQFKPNCNLVIIDFLIRRGYIAPGEEDYCDLVRGLRP